MTEQKVELEVGDVVKYSEPFQNEVESIFIILEVNDDRVIMEALNTMIIRPTYVAQVSDLIKVS